MRPSPTDTSLPPPVLPGDRSARPNGLADAALDDPAIEKLVPGAAQVETITDDESWLKQRLRDPRTIISFLLALAILLFLFTQLKIDPAKIWATIQHANLGFFALGFLIYYSAFALRGLRWQIL